MQSGQAEASIGIYGMVIYTGKRGEGSKELPVQYLSPHPSPEEAPSPYSSFEALQGSSKVLAEKQFTFSSW